MDVRSFFRSSGIPAPASLPMAPVPPTRISIVGTRDIEFPKLSAVLREAFPDPVNSIDVVEIKKKYIKVLSGVYTEAQRNALVHAACSLHYYGEGEEFTILIANHEITLSPIRNSFFHLVLTPLK